jgi:uncharacterized protein
MSERHPIPNQALDDRLGFVGTAGSGKTYNAVGAEERILDRRGRVIHLDPLGVAWGLRLLADVAPLVARVDDEIRRARKERPDVGRDVQYSPTAPPRATPSALPRSPSRAKPAAPVTNGDGADRTLGAERRPLAVLASVHPAGMTEAQWAVAAVLRRTGGTWATYVSRLKMAGRVERQGDLWFATDTGLHDLGGHVEPMPPPGAELVDFWTGKIPAVGPMLRLLADVYPQWVTRDDLAQGLSLAASGGTFSTYLSRLRSPGLIEEDGEKRVRAAETLMGAA